MFLVDFFLRKSIDFLQRGQPSLGEIFKINTGRRFLRVYVCVKNTGSRVTPIGPAATSFWSSVKQVKF